MPARNPYDRRLDERQRRDGMVAGWADGGIFPYGGAPQRSTVEFEDLEAMVGQAAARGRRQVAEQAPERERAARRGAWAEGHDVGRLDGETDLLQRIETRVGAELRAAYSATVEILNAPEDEARRVTKAQLIERLERHEKLLARLAAEHAGAFRGPDGEA